MRSKTAKKILEETPQEVKDRVREEVDKYLNKVGSHDTPEITAHDFMEGYKSAQKIIRDNYNKYNSWLQEERIIKPGKRLNLERIRELEIRVETLLEFL